MTRIAVIGGGKIGEALIAGLLESGRATKDLVVAEHLEARAKELAANYGIRVTNVADAVEGADVIAIAVKPGDVDSVLNAIGEVELDGEREQMLISLVAGIPTSRFELKLPAGFPVVRAMPNTPMLIGQGMSAIAPGRYAREKHIELVNEVLGAVGQVTTISESQIDAATAVSGSGPAYFFLVVEAMVDAAVGLGLSHATATELVVQTMAGSAAMLAVTEESATQLRGAVTSPAGTTAAAIRELERHGVRSAFIEALSAAKARSAQLGLDAES
ncbi:pyrroline-5-carboxylate reductase [Aldersonia kunmingensis]|uniref:pyrroline-5-carboxylate reductase n=1 Tax=Aldersonia kunmingensis TaxID=408066 RepID=UPI000836B717|nr:pyrroline-5-carboxylate reductase [Aldersonia kunmingensis]